MTKADAHRYFRHMHDRAHELGDGNSAGLLARMQRDMAHLPEHLYAHAAERMNEQDVEKDELEGPEPGDEPDEGMGYEPEPH